MVLYSQVEGKGSEARKTISGAGTKKKDEKERRHFFRGFSQTKSKRVKPLTRVFVNGYPGSVDISSK